ncbi:hypothetical protein ACM55G_01130 [Flavobacterium sp. LB3P122]|uniref:hypothetical protein n=1 Tax=Flavobacterium algoriphilum TaxID=3398738 RepID=UPI003A857203
MKEIKYFVVLIMVLFLCNSCSYFTNDKEEKRKATNLKYKKEEEISENKNYQYLSQLVSFKNNISKDTVDIVLKEYYKTYKGFVFNNDTGKLEEMGTFSEDEMHKLDFLQDIVEKYKISEKAAYLILYEIDSMFSMESMKDDIETIDYTVDEIEAKLPEN